ncbi:unnamed protein product [Pylaiella littoralis]
MFDTNGGPYHTVRHNVTCPLPVFVFLGPYYVGFSDEMCIALVSTRGRLTCSSSPAEPISSLLTLPSPLGAVTPPRAHARTHTPTHPPKPRHVFSDHLLFSFFYASC